MVESMTTTQPLPPSPSIEHKFPLHPDQLENFLKYGVLVVENVFTREEVEAALEGMNTTLLKYGVNSNDLMGTGQHLKQLSSHGLFAFFVHHRYNVEKQF